MNINALTISMAKTTLLPGKTGADRSAEDATAVADGADFVGASAAHQQGGFAEIAIEYANETQSRFAESVRLQRLFACLDDPALRAELLAFAEQLVARAGG